MAKEKIILIFFSFLILFTYAQNCVGATSDDLLQTGVVEILNSNTNTRQTLAQTPILYSIPSSGFETALSFIDFQYNSANGFDFSLRGGRIGTSNFLGISVLLIQDRRWQKIKVSYLAHSRKDMWVGSFTYSVWDLSNAQTTSSGLLSAQVQGAVDNWSPDNSSLVYLKAVFLSGLQTGLKDFSLSLTNVTFDKLRGIVGVTLANASKNIQQVTISYLIFVSPHPRFTFDSFNYPGALPVSDYGMIGSSGFNAGFSGARYYGINIESSLLNCYGNCASACISKTNCSQLNGTSNGNDCNVCLNGSRFNNATKTCVAPCGVNQQFVNGTCQCIFGFLKLGNICVNRCGINQQWNGNTCVCLQGYARINGVCRQCPVNSVVNQNRDSCVCQGGLIFDLDTTSCIQTVQCPANSSAVIQGGVYRCKCNVDYYANGPMCSFCPPPALWNTATLLCYCPSLNQFFNGSTCITCKQGQYFNASSRVCQCYSPRINVNGECRCPNNLTYNNVTNRCVCNGSFETPNTNNQCVCIAPYIRLDSGQCGLVCGQNQWWVGGQCICKAPYVRLNSKCSINCTANEKWNGIECVCVQNYFRINGTCQTCLNGQIYNSTTKSCQNICGLNQILNGTNCVCRDNFFRINGICSQCPTGTGYNASLGICQQCGRNQISTNSICVCRVNFVLINGICDQCPVGFTYNREKKTCDSICKLNEIFDGVNCVCATGFVLVNRSCTTCPNGTVYNKDRQACQTIVICRINQVYNGSACVCAADFVVINGLCDKCPVGTSYNRFKQACDTICKRNQVFNGSACVCAQGFVVINGLCDVCPVGSIYNTLRQTCEPLCRLNEIFNGTACICAQGFIIINGLCDRCPVETYYDQSLLKCVTQPMCPLRSQWNQARLQCVCLLNDENLINGTCQKCGTNSAWNGSRCVCRTGFFLIGTECLTCDINTSYNSALKDCICNRGFYGNRTICNKCDSTCGRCSGPNSTQCLDCVDLSFTFINGTCSKPNCISGKYFDGKACQSCTAYCSNCINNQTCTQCSSGFSLSSIDLGQSIKIVFCEQICGDGKRYQYQCDDGNTVNGDGCNDQCQVETGYTCSGGTTTSRSTCLKNNPTRTIITPKGAVQLAGKVLQGVTLSSLPDQLVQKGACTKCSEVLLVSIIQGQVIPSFRVNFLPTSQYKYLVQFDFQGIFAIPPFTFTLRINPDYARFFSQADMAQLITLTVDTALLAKGEIVQDLTIQQILGQKIAIADGDLKKVFG